MIDLLIVTAFIIYSLSSGFIAKSKASQSLEEYFLAGRSVKGWKAGFSMAATQYAADTPLLVMGLIATGGIFMLWRLWIYGIAFLLLGIVLGKSWRRAMVLTDAEFTEIRYSGDGVLFLRGLKAFFYGTLINCTVMAMVLIAATRISEVFLPWNEWIPAEFYNQLVLFVKSIGVPIASTDPNMGIWAGTTNNIISIFVIVAFTALYSTTGGLRSVIATDVAQFIIAMVATAAYAFVIVDEAGGLGNIIDQLYLLYGQTKADEMLSFGPPNLEGIIPFIVIVGLQWFFQLNSDGTGYLAQRTMACKTDRDAKVASIFFTIAQVLVRSLLWLPIGIALLILYPFELNQVGSDTFIANREILFVTGIKDYLPPGLKGLMITGLLAALASTIDTHISWGAGYWSNDIYKRIINEHYLKRNPSRKELVLVARLSSILIVLIALFIMTKLDSIQTAWQVSLLFGAGVGSVLILRWLWERVNIYSEIASIAASFVFAPLILIYVQDEWLRLLLMAVYSTTVVVAITLLTPMTRGDVLQNFYKKVSPSGYWKITASQLGEDGHKPVKHFWNQALTVLTTAATIFLLLIGFGKLILPMESQPLWIPVGSIAIGLVLIPFWWKKATGKTS
jgi:Na+/proline symporter